MRRGHFVLVGVMAFLTPLLSTATSALVLQVHTGMGLWLGCVVVVVGAVVCKLSLVQSK
jgi:drug/metabolite transporter (DMT)-like permease